MNDTLFHLGHVHLKVRDLSRAVAFYEDVFDLELVETGASSRSCRGETTITTSACRPSGRTRQTRAAASAATTPRSKSTLRST
jgi:catechol 2,3-dioxygenase-like lactoylglutathione lyase family enzyme